MKAERDEWRSAASKLDGRLGLPNDAEAVGGALEEYVAAEDALPGDRFDAEDYQLSKAVACLVAECDEARMRLALNGDEAANELREALAAADANARNLERERDEARAMRDAARADLAAEQAGAEQVATTRDRALADLAAANAVVEAAKNERSRRHVIGCACKLCCALTAFRLAQANRECDAYDRADGWIVGHLPGDPPGPASMRWVRADGRVFDCVPRSTEKRDTGRTLTESELAEVRDKYENAKGGDADAQHRRESDSRTPEQVNRAADFTSAEPDHCGRVEDGCLIFVENSCECACCPKVPENRTVESVFGQPWIAEPDDGEGRVAAHMINLLAAVKRARDEANLHLNRDAVHSLALAIERLAVLVTGPRIRSIARDVASKAANAAATKLGANGREQECETMEALVDALASQV